MTSVFINSAEIYIFANDRQFFNSLDHPGYGEVFTNEYKFEMTKDNYYDVLITLNSAKVENDTRIACTYVQKTGSASPSAVAVASALRPASEG